MAHATAHSLRAGHRKALGGAPDSEQITTAREPALSSALVSRYEQNEALRGIPAPVIRKAWLTTAHLLLRPGARIADTGCGEGMMTYAMAAMNPQMNFIGIEPDRKQIAAAKQKWKLPNLEFMTGEFASLAGQAENSLDAIVNSFILHEIYSDSRAGAQAVLRTLEQHFSLLKQGGTMFIRDYAVPSGGEYVLMEMPDAKSGSADPETMEEAELLLWFADNACPRNDPACHGFFLEELPARRPKTRLFHLPCKWAYEFIVRKDDRRKLREELAREYAFFSREDFHKSLSALGARVLYTAPHWDDALIHDRFDGHFRLYNDTGATLGQPPTSFIALARKCGARDSLRLLERRPSPRAQGTFRITAMRNEATGKLTEVVSRDTALTEIIPYRITAEGHLNVFVHDGLPRGIVNAVPRSGRNLDEKYWSGHMTEAMAVESDAVNGIATGDIKAAVLFARDYLGLKPAAGAALETGPAFYPAPDYIDERVETRYLRVENRENFEPRPRNPSPDIAGFSTSGEIVERDAQGILNAVSAGFLPNGQLEMQILALFQMLGMKAESWAECPLVLKDMDPGAKTLDTREFLSKKIQRDSRFKNVKGTTGQMRAIRSIFVDEGQENGATASLASRDLEFIVSDDNTVNKAIVLPLSRSHSGEVMAGVIQEYMPVPQRFQGNGLSVRAPSFVLPKDVTNIEQARQFIAERFNVPVENVARMGESYYCHAGITPQRIFPFAVTGAESGFDNDDGVGAYAPIHELWKLCNWGTNRDRSLMKIVSYVQMRYGESSDLSVSYNLRFKAGGDAQKPAALHAEDLRGLSTSAPDPRKDQETQPNPK